MSQRTSKIVRVFELGDYESYPVKASVVIYEGSAVGITAGYARQLVAGDDFAGFAQETVTGTSADGGIRVSVGRNRRTVLPITSLAVTDVGKLVYASDGDTFTLTQSTNTKIGTVERWIETGSGLIATTGLGGSGATPIAALTDSSGGAAADGTIGAVTLPTAITNSSGSAASNGTIEAVTAPTAQTDSSGGSANATLAAQTLPTAVTGSIGTANGALETVGATNGADVSGAIMNNFQEFQVAQAANLAQLTVLKNVTASYAARQAENRTAIVALTDAIGEFATAQTANLAAITALRSAVTELATKINEIVQ